MAKLASFVSVSNTARSAFIFGDERTKLNIFKNIHLADTGQVFDLECMTGAELHLSMNENLGRIDILFLEKAVLYLFFTNNQ